MPLSPGTRLGPYEITGPLGAGGMGEVFRARDTRLDRDVAIKVLPQHLSARPEMRARFKREAKTISSLNHPHICTLFDVGWAPGEAGSEDTDYLVMELLEGETLASRLARGALSGPEVLKLGGQIADALDRAHRAGVIHRDLKPSNVMLTRSGAKLMDFGIALTAETAQSGVGEEGLEQSPTMSMPLTAEGTIVGTLVYMAPEQFDGREVDARSDLWALGCVLYEMATARPAFKGKSVAALISAIVGSQPAPISQLAPLAPPGLERLVLACLAKDPAERLQSAHDVRMQLAWLAEGGAQAGVPVPVAARRRSRERPTWMLAGAGLIMAALLAWRSEGPRGPGPEAIRSLIEAPPDARLDQWPSDVVLAPDGRTMAFVADLAVWVRPLDSEAATRLPGTEPATSPFWSPDSRFIAYFDWSTGKLMKVAAAGGSPVRVCDASSGRGGSWSRDGTIVFAPAPDGPLMRVAAAGGDPIAVTTLDETRHERGHRFPCFLPDGEHFLFGVLPGGPDGWDTYVGSLRSNTVQRLLTAGSAAVYAEPGYLLFERDGRVLAQRFDPGRLELRGASVAIADAPERSNLDAEPVASASQNGRLAILRSVITDTRLEMRDQAGATTARYDLPPGPWRVSSVAPDGRRAAVLKGDEIWVVDLVRLVPTRLATSSASDPSSVWSPDGSRLAFGAKHDGREEIYIADLDGRANPVPTTDDEFKMVCDWSHDGRYIVFAGLNAETNWDLWILPMDGDRKPVPYLRGPTDEVLAALSPNGRWLAYVSDETGQREVYVQSFPEPGRKVRVSLDGGRIPGWADGGANLWYVNRTGREVLAVPVEDGEEFQPGPPRKIVDVPADVTSRASVGDGSRSLVAVATNWRPRDIQLIVDWTALLAP